MSLIYQPPVVVSSSSSTSSNQPTTSPRPGLYVGGKADAKDFTKLKQRNVTHILNLTPAKETGIEAGVPNYFPRAFQYRRIPLYDSALSLSDLRDHADSICDFIAQALECHHSSILVHCQQGVSRSVTAALLYLMRRVDMSYEDAMALMLRRRPQANPLPAFRVLLQEDQSTKALEKDDNSKEKLETDDTANEKEEENEIQRPQKPDRGPRTQKRAAATAPIGPQRPPKK